MFCSSALVFSIMNMEYFCSKKKKRCSLLHYKVSKVRARMEGFEKWSLDE